MNMNDMLPAARFEKLLLDDDRKAIYKYSAAGQSHCPVFTVTVTIDGKHQDVACVIRLTPFFLIDKGIAGISATATDSTKKGAKHKACNLALKQMTDGVGGHTWSSLHSCLEGWHFEEYASSRVQQDLESENNSPEHESFNFIGALSEFCQKETSAKVVGPEYKDQDFQIVGQNNRVFEIECNLYFKELDGDRRLVTTGTGSTKKSAKRQAAAEMYRLLVAEGRVLSVKPILKHKPDGDPVAGEIETATEAKEDDPATTEWDDQSVDQPDEQLSPAHTTDFFEQMQDLAVDQKLKCEVQDLSTDSSGCFKCMISALSDETSGDRARVCCGDSSSSFEDAKQNAAQNMIKILKG